MSKRKNDALMAFAKELEPGTTMIPCGAIFTRRLFFFTPIFHLRNKKGKELLCWLGFLLVPGHNWHNHHRRRHLLFLLGDCYEIGFLWVLERNIDVIKTRVLERELPEIGFPMLHGDVVFEHRDRQTSQYPGAVSC